MELITPSVITISKRHVSLIISIVSATWRDNGMGCPSQSLIIGLKTESVYLESTIRTGMIIEKLKKTVVVGDRVDGRSFTKK